MTATWPQPARRLAGALLRTLPFVLVVVIWQGLHASAVVSPALLPSPRQVFEAGVRLAGRGVIFQQYAVFPYLTVHQNVVFGLTLRANFRSKAERDRIAKHRIGPMGLNDEPFAALDAQTRELM